MPGEFQNRALQLFRDGHRVVPIPRGLKGVLIEGWTQWADSQDEAHVRDLLRTANGCGVGVLSKWTAGIDIDVRHPELAQRLAGLAHSMLGWTVERIGAAPKVLLPYRVETPFLKVSSHEFTLPDDEPGEKPHRIEVLGDGQQWVAYHVHPDTGQPYVWPEGELPPRGELPELDEAKARLFIERAEAAIIAYGGRIKAKLRERGQSADRRPSSQGQAGTIEGVKAALRAFPNSDLDYDEWIEVGLAIKGALGDEGQDLWEKWSAQSSKDEPKATTKAWKGFSPQSIGAGTLYHLARKRGWKPPREVELNPEKVKKKAKRAERAPASGRPASEAHPPHDPVTGEIREPDHWADLLLRSERTGAAHASLANIIVALENAPELRGHFRWNEMTYATEVGGLPWREHDGWRDWEDVDDIRLAEWCAHQGFNARTEACAQAVLAVSRDHAFHPVRDYLFALKWDDTDRLTDFFNVYFGASYIGGPGLSPPEREEAERQKAYLQAIGRKWMIAAVARVMEPGCKADHTPVIEGVQGLGKSTAIKALMPNEDWFADQFGDLHSKDSWLDLRGKWVVEIAELANISRHEIERVKAFMSRTVDHGRPPYGRRAIDAPRQCVFVGTTNLEQYLKDETGNRRFWPVRAQSISLNRIRADRDQLWAQALALYRAKESWHLDREMEAAAEVEQEKRYLGDEWDQPVEEWLARQTAPDHSLGDIIRGSLGLPPEKWDQAVQNRMSRVLRGLHWYRFKAYDPATAKRSWRYRHVP